MYRHRVGRYRQRIVSADTLVGKYRQRIVSADTLGADVSAMHRPIPWAAGIGKE